MDLGIIQEQFQKSFQEAVDKEIKNILIGSTATATNQTADPLKDLQNMICKMTTVIMCSPNMKQKIESLEELPNMTKIIPNSYLEDNTAYLITDEKLKRSLLGYGSGIEIDLSQWNA